MPIVLVVDDEVRSLETLARTLDEDFQTITANSVRQAEAILETEWVQIVLCDQRMPDMTGVEFLGKVRDQWPEVIRMIISGYTDSQDIISAVNDAGIYQYISKPWQPENLILSLNNAARLSELQRQNEVLSVELKMTPRRLEVAKERKRKTLRERYHCDDGIVRTAESSTNRVCDKIRRVSPFDVSVLLTGESGTGKELAARPCITTACAGTNRSWWRTVRPCPTRCSRVSCSAARRAPSPVRWKTGWACSSAPAAARYFSTRSARCLPLFRSSCCG